MPAMSPRLRENLDRVRSRIADACAAAGRGEDSVTLVAVVKYADLAWVRGLVSLGERDLGEARPQQLADRVRLLEEPIRWHLIGSLQRNKVRPTLESLGPAGCIHSVDSTRLLDRIARVADDLGLAPPSLLLQTNVTGEATKQGFAPDDLAAALAATSLPVAGLMTMAARSDDPDGPRRTFDRLAELRDALATAERPLPMLSMGMSGDLEPAIAAGATHVRIGSALFEGLGEG